MSTQRRRQASEPIGLIITLLALVALIGLLTGILTRALVSPHPLTGQSTSTRTASAPTDVVTPPTSTVSIPATATDTAAPITTHFQLSVTATPRSVSAGQAITITVEAFNPDTHAPIAGLPCILRAPMDGSQSLFTTWPDGQSTNASGVVSWTLTTPKKSAGNYEIEAYAKTASWSWKADSVITLLAS